MKILLIALFIYSSNALYPTPIFNCNKLPIFPTGQDVNHIRPQDIKAIMALGDSISAGFAMKAGRVYDLLDLVEFRGSVFSVGGDEGAYTIANFLKLYSPNIQGASIGKSLPLDAIKWKGHIIQPFDPKHAHLNGAQSQAKIGDVPPQIDYLVDQLRTTYNKSVNFQKDWKLLTILIGANNLCGACKNRSYADPDYFETQLDIVLTKVFTSIPRVFVNVIPMFNISPVYTAVHNDVYCRFMWQYIVDSECMCLQGKATPEDRLIMDLRAVEFRKRVFKVADKWASKGLTEFKVVAQPFTVDLYPLDITFLSKFDCFHPSLYSDGAFAIGLWNNMLSPESEKVHTLDPKTLKFKCPNENTFLQ